MTIKALKIAYDAHLDQMSHDGIPYIFHPYHLAEQMDDEVSCTVALLHDVIEDTDITLDDLKKEFPLEVTDALALLTHTDGTDYFDYVRAIKSNPIAVKVKLADLAHNSDETRLCTAPVPSEKLEYWRQKYSRAKKILAE